MRIKGITVILLLGMLLVAGVVCGEGQGVKPTPTPTYISGNVTLAIDSVGPGYVYKPGEGIFSYEWGTLVELDVTVPPCFCQFEYWSGDVESIADINSWHTTLTMYGNYSIIAHFRHGDYERAKHEIGLDVNEFKELNTGILPIINGATAINISVNDGELISTSIIDVCSLLIMEGGVLETIPEGCISIPGDNNDNCDSGSCNCSASAHYIYTTDENGKVYSTCVGEECDTNYEDGYQSVWP